jgi:hypothetical protein
MIIVDPSGRAIPNKGILGPHGEPLGDDTGLYHEHARIAKGEQIARYPELSTQFSWGGSHGTLRPSGGPPDWMHFDLGGERGHWTSNQPSRMGPLPGLSYGTPVAPAAKPAVPEGTTAENSPHPPAPEATEPKPPAGWKKQDEKLKAWPEAKKADKGTGKKADHGTDEDTPGKGKSKVEVNNAGDHAPAKDQHMKLAGSLNKGLKVDNRSDYNVSLESSGAI